MCLKEAKEVELKNVTITPKNGGDGSIFESEVLLHQHDVDGSQIILLKTPRRKSIERFLKEELIQGRGSSKTERLIDFLETIAKNHDVNEETRTEAQKLMEEYHTLKSQEEAEERYEEAYEFLDLDLIDLPSKEHTLIDTTFFNLEQALRIASGKEER